MTDEEDEQRNFYRKLMDAANATDAGKVAEIVGANEIVFAVWEDASAPYGARWLLLKGASALARGAQMRQSVYGSAIKCSSAEEAEALFQLHGER
jgi:hypothetical protein